MGVKSWIQNFLFNENGNEIRECFIQHSAELQIKKLAIETCIDLIANTLTTCEFLTYERGKETRKNNYYLFNVQPNINENSSEFIHKLVHTLVWENSCLVIMQDEQLVVADDYSVTEYALKENMYKNVVVGDLKFDKIFYESEVLHYKLNNNNIRKIIDDFYDSFGKLIGSAVGIYKYKNALRYLAKGKTLNSKKQDDVEAANNLFNKLFQSWMDPDKSTTVMYMGEDTTLEDMSPGGKATSTTATSRDIRALIDDVFDFVASAFHVPKSLIKGDLADVEKQTDNYLMFCIKPLVKLLNAEFNRKMYTKEEYLERTYLKIDPTYIKILDIVNMATAADKFFAIGANTINDNLRMLGREPIEEDWADKRFVTKNYQMVEDVETLKGGEGGQ